MRNAGSTPFTYTIAGGLGGADAAAFAGSLRLSIVANGTRSGTGSAATCTSVPAPSSSRPGRR